MRNKILNINKLISYKTFIVKRYIILNENIRKIAINEIRINEYLIENQFNYSPKMIKVLISRKYIDIYFEKINTTKLNRKPLIKKRLSHILKKLHSINVCHNDLNLSNILSDGKNIYLIDFALASISSEYDYDYIKLKKIESWIDNGTIF
ncbi:lipopolysaccharide kinase InaA family protein [Oceanivirga miroungae]|uniref:3-deoxy-D-manno-octulosonic acid kinase n=1 Tax=Oceanivirga miroungae TaxID=1130046 RepID=A0A6I8MBV1_9FUSO|nr:lipopolysaccharide kinase InaA family protein [Oceanivirga miroungae]VWL84907.1 3-deoxy-D-manno-octulosonic acid kinase [Oceanivirga miroungae]